MKKRIGAFLTGINLLVAVVFLNVWLSFYPFWRIDLSANKIHSLSKASRKIAKEMEDVVKIKVFMSQELPAEVGSVARNLKTILTEFSALNQSKIKVVYKDPSKNEEAASEAMSLGIRPLQFSTIKSDKFEVSSGYLGLVLAYGENQEVLPVAGNIGNLEYFLLSGIKRLTSDERITVAIADKSGAESQIGFLKRFLDRDYSLVEVDLAAEEELPSEAKTLLVVGDPGQLSQDREAALSDFLAEDRGLVAFVDKVMVSGATMQATAGSKLGLEGILKQAGMEIEAKLILDESSTIANFRTEEGAFLSQYPYWPEIRPENFNSQVPAVSGLNSLMLAWASPIKLGEGAEGLFFSSQRSALDEDLTDLSPLTKREGIEFVGRQVVGAINRDRRTVVVADSDMISDQFVNNSQQNLILALNLVDYMSQDESLLTIRSKVLGSFPLRPVTDKVKTGVKVVSLVIPVVLLVATATGINWLRNKKRARWLKT